MNLHNQERNVLNVQHAKQIGLTEIYNDKRIWPQWEVCCISCAGLDPDQLPATIPAPTQAPTIKAVLERGNVMRFTSNDDVND